MLEKAALNYKSMDPREKRILNETKTQTYKSMDPIKKKILNETKTHSAFTTGDVNLVPRLTYVNLIKPELTPTWRLVSSAIQIK